MTQLIEMNILRYVLLVFDLRGQSFKGFCVLLFLEGLLSGVWEFFGAHSTKGFQTTHTRDHLIEPHTLMLGLVKQAPRTRFYIGFCFCYSSEDLVQYFGDFSGPICPKGREISHTTALLGRTF